MKKTGKFIFLGILTIALSQLILVGCFEEDNTDYAAQERKILEQYLLDNNITVDPTASGLYFIPGDTGTGPFAEIGDTLNMYFAGFTLYDKIIATNIQSVAIEYGVEEYFTNYDPLIFRLGDPGIIIPGIEEGLTYMKAGGTATMILPSDIAIPGTYTTLLYNIQVLEVIEPGSQ